MHRSISKTRGQLQRITYKINQLKSKYITDGQPHLKLDKSLPASPEKEQIYGRSPMTSHSNLHNEIYPKELDVNSNREFKLFRNQIYQYIDKCLLSNREKQQDFGSKVRKTKISSTVQERILKIEEQLTSCLSTNQQIMVQLKKIDKKNNEKIGKLQENILKDVAKENLRMQVQSKQRFKAFEQSLRSQICSSNDRQENDQIINSVKQLQEKLNNLSDKLQTKINKQTLQTKETYEMLQKKINREILTLSQSIGQLSQELKEEKQSIFENSEQMKKINEQILQFEQSLHQSYSKQQEIAGVENETNEEKVDSDGDKNNVEEIITQMYQTLQQNLRKQMCDALAKFTNKIQIFEAQSQERRDKMEKNIVEISDGFKLKQTNLKEQIINNMKQIGEKVLDQALQIVNNNKTEYQQLFSHRMDIIVKAVEDLKIKSVQKENKVHCQIENLTKFYDIQAEKTKQQMCKKIQYLTRFMQKMEDVLHSLQQKIQQKHENKELKKQSSHELCGLSQKQKTNTQEEEEIVRKKTDQQKSSSPMSINKDSEQQDISSMVDEKLNQFQSDINDTLKLLYDDFDVKVKEVFSIIDYSAIKEDIEFLKQQIRAIKQLQGNKKQQIIEQSGMKEENEIQLKNQIYEHMGESIEKLSMVLQRTVQEMETKMQKLDQNFNYIYEKLSSVEFDNAKFKDRLESYMKTQPKQTERQNISRACTPDKKSSEGNILDVLGTFSSGGKFCFEDS